MPTRLHGLRKPTMPAGAMISGPLTFTAFMAPKLLRLWTAGDWNPCLFYSNVQEWRQYYQACAKDCVHPRVLCLAIKKIAGPYTTSR